MPRGAAEKSPAVTKDTSPHVHQRGKLKIELSIRDLDWTDNQKTLIELAMAKGVKVVFITGPAGTSKTLLAAYCALHLLNDKKISDIIYLRSAVESSDAKLGFLPGTADDKLSFYNLPFWDKLDELLPKGQIDALKKEERVHCFPINYIRGLSWNAKAIILDEAQNSSQREIITALTRLGEFTHLFVLADPFQSDLQHGRGGFSKLIETFNDDDSLENGIVTFAFNEDDVMRSAIVKFIVKKLNREIE